MDYRKEYRRFITSHYLGDGVRITIGIALPAIVLSYFNLLPEGIALSLGAMCASTTDIPGPIHHRRNGMMLCIAAVFMVASLTTIASPYPVAMGLLIVLFCFAFCMIGVYGARSIALGVAALLIMVLSIDRPMNENELLLHLLYLTAGGAWYMLLSLALYSIRPYKLAQQALGESILNTSTYLRIRALFYAGEVNYDEVYQQMLEQQVKVEQSQQLVNELLFKNRTVIKESIPTGRILMMIHLDVLDLFEKTITSFQDYKQLHSYFDGTGILQKYQSVIYKIADELDEIGIAVQGGYPAKANEWLQQSVQQLKTDYESFRNERHTAVNLEGLINLRQILQSIEDIVARLTTLQLYTTYDKKKIKTPDAAIDYSGLLNTQSITWELLKDNLTLDSNTFRHAVRVSIATLAGYIISRFFSIGHSYWILLTIVVILKPTYSLTQKRNYQRLWGTATGALLALILLYTIENKTALFACMIILMIGTYSFVRTNYLIGVLCTTAYVLVLFHLVYGTNLKTIFTDRLVDTALGSLIAFFANFLIVPAWEKEKIKDYMLAALEKNIVYFKNVSAAFLGKPVADTELKKSRQDAFVALANLSDAFTRMLSEPKFRQQNSQQIHRFVVLNHTLTSHIATLSHYVLPLSSKYASQDFNSIIRTDIHQLETTKSILHNEPVVENTGKSEAHKINERLSSILEKRRHELDQKLFDTETRKLLGELKPVVDQFNLISSIAEDLKKTSKEIKM
ncbi:MAG: FUSC family membrane protein [Chitinophagaceae bacterium]